MKNINIDHKDSLFQVTENYNEALELLISLGFDNLKDEEKRRTLGKIVTIGDSLKSKGISLSAFVEQLEERLQLSDEPKSGAKDGMETIRMAGVLPCPVRIPLLETFEEWHSKQDLGFHLEYDLKAASMGIGWLEESLKSEQIESLPDLFISAGFDMFFDKKLFGKYKSRDLFEDLIRFENYNEDFENGYLSLRDPKKQYSMIGVVPAVFLINVKELGERKMPRSWEDVLHEDFRNSISLPVSDFDLFNAILLNIYKMYGEEGIVKLGRNMQRSMHPSEMVKSHAKLLERPSVTIMPYFFTKMVKNGGPMEAVWPEDGAIMSPIFLLTKKEKKEQLQPIVDFLSSKGVGEILAHNGRFPSTNPQVDNRVAKENRYMWLGWDFIEEHDLTALIRRCEELFNLAMKGDM
ncbi:ABC transporter substrate-binding protein [Proteiniclasticum sp. C24MP]|uniref:ABC transporter substrate-binding protein n=1 Tax=Proteiniclasticum sp. C24MP TaxID=3374101 RepID=UPI0037542F4F